MKQSRLWLLAFCLVGLVGCASIPEGQQADGRDPWERYNRAVFSFNMEVDTAVVKPLAEGYQAAVPEVIRGMVRHFFGNLNDLVTSVHHLLQGEPTEALTAAGRFLVNSTLGFFGVSDPASELGLAKSREDFGLTLGVWGAEPGPYLVLPLLGPSTVRDGLGTAVDMTLDPLDPIFDSSQSAQNTAVGLRLLDTRVSLLGLEPALSALSFDRYSAVRDAYLARRAQQVNPNAPFREETED